MKRSEMIDIIKRQLYGDSNYPGHEDEATALLGVIEKAGMKPPCVSEDDCQALMNVYVGGNFYQWDEDLAKDEKVQECKLRRAAAKADKRPLRLKFAERRAKKEGL